MRKTRWTIALLVGLGLAAPAVAGDRAEDAKDTATETTSDAKKGLRNLKPGDKTAADRKADAKDTAKSAKAKTRKKARAAKREVKEDWHEAKGKVKETTK